MQVMYIKCGKRMLDNTKPDSKNILYAVKMCLWFAAGEILPACIVRLDQIDIRIFIYSRQQIHKSRKPELALRVVQIRVTIRICGVAVACVLDLPIQHETRMKELLLMHARGLSVTFYGGMCK